MAEVESRGLMRQSCGADEEKPAFLRVAVTGTSHRNSEAGLYVEASSVMLNLRILNHWLTGCGCNFEGLLGGQHCLVFIFQE